MRLDRIVLGAGAAALLAATWPAGARADDCTGIAVGHITYWTCTGGASFTEQRIGNLVYLSGDVTGYRQQIGGIEYLHIDDPLPPPVVVLPPIGAGPGAAPGAAPGGAWNLFGQDLLE